MKRLATSLAFALLISACYSPQAKAISLTELPSTLANITWNNPVPFLYVCTKLLQDGSIPNNQASTLAAVNMAEVCRDVMVGDEAKKNMNFFTKTLVDRLGVLMTAGFMTLMNGSDFIKDKDATLYVLSTFFHRLVGNYLGK